MKNLTHIADLPRKLDFSTLGQKELDRIAAELNERLRETLDCKTPAERCTEFVVMIGSSVGSYPSKSRTFQAKLWPPNPSSSYSSAPAISQSLPIVSGVSPFRPNQWFDKESSEACCRPQTLNRLGRCPASRTFPPDRCPPDRSSWLNHGMPARGAPDSY